MSNWAVGDVQGCLLELDTLLETISFQPDRDHLYLLGDIVNRGPDSLGTLRRVRALGPAATVVLGNHDLHLLAAAAGGRRGRRDTLDAVLAAPDCKDLLDWLASCPLAVHLANPDTVLVHAGLAPQWAADTALALAAEASAVIRGPAGRDFLAAMYGDDPGTWDASLAGHDRTRFVVNALTRLRYCDHPGALRLDAKASPGDHPDGLLPWFQHPQRASQGTRIVFGHWSTLGQVAWPGDKAYCLDTGCVWGGTLTAMNLDSGRTVQVPSRQPKHA